MRSGHFWPESWSGQLTVELQRASTVRTQDLEHCSMIPSSTPFVLLGICKVGIEHGLALLVELTEPRGNLSATCMGVPVVRWFFEHVSLKWSPNVSSSHIFWGDVFDPPYNPQQAQLQNFGYCHCLCGHSQGQPSASTKAIQLEIPSVVPRAAAPASAVWWALGPLPPKHRRRT